MCRAGQGAAPLSASVAVCVPRAHRPHVPPQNCGPSAHPCGHSTATVRPFGTRRASGTARSTAAGGGRWRGGDGCSLGWRQRGRGATGTGGAGPGVQAEPWGLSRGTEPGARGWARGGGAAGWHPDPNHGGGGGGGDGRGGDGAHRDPPVPNGAVLTRNGGDGDGAHRGPPVLRPTVPGPTAALPRPTLTTLKLRAEQPAPRKEHCSSMSARSWPVRL